MEKSHSPKLVLILQNAVACLAILALVGSEARAQGKPQPGKDGVVTPNGQRNDLHKVKKVETTDATASPSPSAPPPKDDHTANPSPSAPPPKKEETGANPSPSAPPPKKEETQANPSPSAPPPQKTEVPADQEKKDKQKKTSSGTLPPASNKSRKKTQAETQKGKGGGKRTSASRQQAPQKTKSAPTKTTPAKTAEQQAAEEKAAREKAAQQNSAQPGSTQQSPAEQKVPTSADQEKDKVKTGGEQTSFLDRLKGTGPNANGPNANDQQNGDIKAAAVPATDAAGTATGDAGVTAPEHFKKPCEDEALRKIYEHVLKDQGNVLAEMFELTALRLARRAAEQQQTTVEDRVKADVDLVQKRLEEMKGSKEIMDSVGKIYATYGLANDANLIQQDLEGVFRKGKDACYWTRTQRIENLSASAYILAVSAGEKDSGLSETDAATVWVVDRIREQAAQENGEYAFGKKFGNLLNVTTRAARYLGRIHGGVKYSPEEMQAEIKKREEQIAGVMSGAVTAVEKELQDCISKRNSNCTDCDKRDLESFKSEVAKVGMLQNGLLEALSKSNAKIVDGLKGKMGEVTFDFSNYAQSTSVPRDTRRGRVDACGHPLKGGGTQRNTAATPVKGAKTPQKKEKTKTEGQQTQGNGQQPAQTTEQPAAQSPQQTEWEAARDLWSIDHPAKDAAFKFDAAQWKAWKPKMETWRKNHPGRQPPPNDPALSVDAAYLNHLVAGPKDLRCEPTAPSDCMVGMRVLYQFSSPEECAKLCKTQRVHKHK